MDGVPLVASGKIVQNGREVYKWAVSEVSEGAAALLAACGRTIDAVDWFAPHNANVRMLESIAERTGIPMEKTLHCLPDYGNTSAASIPLAIDAAFREGKVRAGDELLLYGFGGGLVQAGLLLRWTL